MKRRKLCSLLLAGSLILSSLSSSIGAYAEDVNDTTVSQDEDNPNETVISTEDSSIQILTEEEMQKLGITEFTSEDTTNEDITESSDDEETTSEDATTNEETQDTTTVDETTTEVTSDDQEEVSEEVTEKDSEDISTEEVTEESSEDVSEEVSEETTEELVKTPSFTEKVEGVFTANLDFSSKELLVGTEDPTIFTWDTQVISEYNSVYLVRFDDIQTTENAYTYYFKKADFVSTNNTFKAADEEFVENDSNITEEDLTANLSNINQGDDAISVLNDIVDTIDNDIDTDIIKSDKVIALIDTGVNADDLVGSVSVIGDDTSDDNGHGTAMYNYIKEENPNAKILSIKALDSNSKGQASDIYAAIQYAIEAKVDIINLSLSANSIEENNIVIQAIEDAIDAGITVVGAAGNNGANAKYFIPGCIDDAIIIGACTYQGYKLNDSNYGNTVDGYLVSSSTSEAAAKMSGLISRLNVEDALNYLTTIDYVTSKPTIEIDHDVNQQTREENNISYVDNQRTNATKTDKKLTLGLLYSGSKEYTTTDEIYANDTILDYIYYDVDLYDDNTDYYKAYIKNIIDEYDILSYSFTLNNGYGILYKNAYFDKDTYTLCISKKAFEKIEKEDLYKIDGNELLDEHLIYSEDTPISSQIILYKNGDINYHNITVSIKDHINYTVKVSNKDTQVTIPISIDEYDKYDISNFKVYLNSKSDMIDYSNLSYLDGYLTITLRPLLINYLYIELFEDSNFNTAYVPLPEQSNCTNRSSSNIATFGTLNLDSSFNGKTITSSNNSGLRCYTVNIEPDALVSNSKYKSGTKLYNAILNIGSYCYNMTNNSNEATYINSRDTYWHWWMDLDYYSNSYSVSNGSTSVNIDWSSATWNTSWSGTDIPTDLHDASTRGVWWGNQGRDYDSAFAALINSGGGIPLIALPCTDHDKTPTLVSSTDQQLVMKIETVGNDYFTVSFKTTKSTGQDGYVRYRFGYTKTPPSNFYIRPFKTSTTTTYNPSKEGITYKLYDGTGTNAHLLCTWVVAASGTVTKETGSVTPRQNSLNDYTFDSTNGKYLKITDPNGSSTLNMDLYLYETSANDNYVSNDSYLKIPKNTLSKDKYYTVTSNINTNKDTDDYKYIRYDYMKNHPYLYTTMRKTGEDTLDKSGIIYGLYDANNTLIYEITLNSGGYIDSVTKKVTDSNWSAHKAKRGTTNNTTYIFMNKNDKLTTSCYYKEISGNDYYALSTTPVPCKVATFESDGISYNKDSNPKYTITAAWLNNYASDTTDLKYIPYYVCLTKKEVAPDGTKKNYANVEFTFYYYNSGSTTATKGSTKKTDSDGFVWFEIPTTAKYTSATKPTSAYAIETVPTGHKGPNDNKVEWDASDFKTSQPTSGGKTIENPVYFSYKGAIIKKDQDDGILEGVPFKYRIGTSGTWSDIVTTGSDGTYTVTTGKNYVYGDTAPVLQWQEQSWNGYTVKLHKDNKVTTVKPENYSIDTSIKSVTMSKDYNNTSVATYTHRNYETSTYYVTLYKESKGSNKNPDMTGIQYSLYWNKQNAENNGDKFTTFTLNKQGKVNNVTESSWANGKRLTISKVTKDNYVCAKIVLYSKDNDNYDSDKERLESGTGLYLKETKTNDDHVLNTTIDGPIHLVRDKVTILDPTAFKSLTDVQKIYISLSIKKTNSGQNYSMAGIKYDLIYVKGTKETPIAIFNLAADGSVSSITPANLLVDGHGTMSVEDSGKWLKITFDDGRDVTDEETNGFFILKEREDSNNSFYEMNTNTTKVDSSKLEHGSMTQVTATLNQIITDEYQDALTDTSYTPYYLVVDKNIIDTDKNSFNANGIPFNITIKDSTGKVVKTVNGIKTGSYYNFDNGETKSIQTYETVTANSTVSPLADQTFSFIITRDGKAIKNMDNKDVVYTTTKKDGRIIVYLGTYKKLDNGKCPITVDVQEAWVESIKADKITVNGTELNIEKVESKDYIHTFKKTGIIPSEMNENEAKADSTTFTIPDAKTLKVDNKQSTTAITLIKTSGENNYSNTYKYTHNVTTKSGQTNCPNMNYSLEGATYEITNKEGDVVGTLRCNEDGTTDILDISEDFNEGNPNSDNKNYYAEEKAPGKNYALNSTKVKLTVTKDNNINNPAVFNVYDDILLDPVTINLNKVDADTYSDLSQEGSVAAKYTIRYYPVEIISGHYYTATELDALNIEPEKYEITLVKNAITGKYEFNTTDLIGEKSMGYFTITEDTAPTGYGITGSKFIVTLADGTKQEVNEKIPVYIIDREDPTSTTNFNVKAYIIIDGQRKALRARQSTGSLEITSVEPTTVPPTFDSISVSTTTGTHVGRVNNETLTTDSITETFSIKDVPLDRVYTYKATLMDITNINNTKAITTKSVDYKSTGIAEQSFEIKFDSFKPQAGHTYATVVRIYGKDKDGNVVERYTHNTDYSVETQKVYYPSISTTIKSNSTNTQAGALIANEKVTDTITYSNFPVGTKVIFSGTLYDLTNNTKINETPVTKEVTIDDKTSTDIVFTYDARGLKGRTLAAVVTASVNSEVVIAHNLNKSEVSEMVYYPDVNTELLASTNTHLGSVQANETTVETVNFKNVPEGVEVVAVGTLYDVTDNKNVGSIVTSDPKTSTGLGQQTITLPAFTYDASSLAGHILSAKVEIKVGNVVIGTHNDDYSDVKETIYYPTIATDLVSGKTNTQLGSKSKTETAIETVTYTNVPKDTTITLIGELWNTKTNEIITLADGKTQATVTSKSNGLGENTADITFTYDSTGLDDTVIAAKVFVKLGNNDITKHNDDLTDTREMVYYPKLSTELLSVYGSKNYKVGKVNTSADEKETAKETVTFKGIPKDVEVTYYAELRDVTNSNALITLSNTDAVNNVLVKTVKSTGLDEQSFNFVFEYNSMNLADHILSAKVTAKIGDNLIGVHNEDLTDLKETIYYPNGHTSAADVDTTTKLVQKSEIAKIYDDFIFSNLVKGINYTLTGTLHKRDKDGKDLGILYDSKNKPVEKTITISVKADGTVTAEGAESVTFNSTSEETVSGTIRVLFTVDSSLLEGITTTAFETVKVDDYDIFVHANIDDKDQQVHFMKLETDLVSDKTGTNVAAVVKEDVVKDKLSFEKVPYGAIVVFNGTMMDKDAKSELVIDGNPITGTVTLTVDANGNVTTSSGIAAEVTGIKDSKTNTVSGTIILTYKYDSTSLRNKTLVSFVTATHNDKTVYVHNSYDDKRETIYYPDIHTNANDINTKVNVATLGTTKVIDTVTLNNLVCGKTYQVVGTVHIKDEANNNPVLKIDNKEVTKKATITIAEDGTVTLDNAENAQFTVGDGVINGTVDIVFDVDTSSILGKDMVAFEKLLTEPVELVAHEDINDKDQTVHVPDGGTTAMDAQTKDHVGTVLEEGNIDLPDTVHLENIAIGHTYHIDGIIMDKETGESLKIDNNEVTASADFTVDANGNITSENSVENIDYVDGDDVISFDIILNFNFASKDLKGKDIVVFETGYFVNGNTKVKIFEEDDITNLDQTVHFPEVSTIATDDTYKDHIGIASETESITEKSILTNLVFGMTYEVKATVMDQLTGEALKDKSGNEVTKTAIVTISDDGKTVTAVEKDTDTQLVVTIDRVDEDDHCIDITVDIPIVFDSTGTNGKSIVLFEDLSHNDIIVKSHHDINDTDEQIHYFELVLYKKGLSDPTVAEFTLTQNGSTIKYSKLDNGSYIINPEGTITVLNPDSDGIIHIKGFNADPYVLTEIKTAEGVNLLTSPITIQFVSDDSDKDNIIRGLEVSIDGKKALIVSTDPEKPYTIQLDVTNNESITLKTGGNGTYMFYILALIVLLVAGASVIIYRKRRKNQ